MNTLSTFAVVLGSLPLGLSYSQYHAVAGSRLHSPSNTLQHKPASPISTSVVPHDTAHSKVGIRARQTTVAASSTITEAPAVIVWEQSTQYSGFPDYLCGFISGDPNLAFTCADTYDTCAVAGNEICCASSGQCPIKTTTSCQNVDISDYNDPNWGSSAFVISSVLYCDLYQGIQCGTNVLGTIASETICQDTSYTVFQSVWPPAQFLEYFAGHTLEWNYQWSLTAIKAPSTAAESSTATSTAVPTDPVGYLSKFSTDDPPSCVSNMTSLCPSLYRSIQICANTTTHKTSCYCEALIDNRCTGLCVAGSQANQYLNYILPECEGVLSNSSSANTTANRSLNFTSSWPDYTNLTDTAYLRLFPWRWDLRSNSSELANATANRTSIEASDKLEQCPTVQSALVSFAIVNAIVFLASVITANRHVVYFITCHMFGGKEGGKWWPASALLSVAINLAGNFINALLIIRTPGYRHVPLLPLVLLWCTRPRLAWLVILLVYITKRFGKDMTTYLDSAVAALMAEIILQAFGAVYMGFSINHARVNEFYLLGHLKYTPHGSDALIMYAGALLWTVSVGIAFLRAVYTFTPVGGIVKEAIISIPYYIKMAALYLARGLYWIGVRIYFLFDREYVFSWPESLHKAQAENLLDDPPPYVSEKERIAQYIEDMGLKPRLLNELKTLVIALLIPWVAQWIFWIGFVRMAQDLYCPPKIWSLTAVWSICSLVAMWCGASF